VASSRIVATRKSLLPKFVKGEALVLHQGSPIRPLSVRYISLTAIRPGHIALHQTITIIVFVNLKQAPKPTAFYFYFYFYFLRAIQSGPEAERCKPRLTLALSAWTLEEIVVQGNLESHFPHDTH
jgi:hypothetical protein